MQEMEARMLKQDRVSAEDGGSGRAELSGKGPAQSAQPTRKHLMDQQVGGVMPAYTLLCTLGPSAQ